MKQPCKQALNITQPSTGLIKMLLAFHQQKTSLLLDIKSKI